MNSTQLIQFLEKADLNPRSYSGRGMYGRECVGFTFDESIPFAISKLLYGITESEIEVDSICDIIEDLALLLEDARMDSMGLGTIMYFPNMPWIDDYNEGDD